MLELLVVLFQIDGGGYIDSLLHDIKPLPPCAVILDRGVDGNGHILLDPLLYFHFHCLDKLVISHRTPFLMAAWYFFMVTRHERAFEKIEKYELIDYGITIIKIVSSTLQLPCPSIMRDRGFFLLHFAS